MNISIDGLRGIALILVMLFHAGAPFSQAGWLGVDLFFALSGFLITTLLIREYDKCGEISFKKFWLRRFLRLMPVYVLYILLITIAVLSSPAHELHTVGGFSPAQYLVGLWTYTFNFIPLGGIWAHQAFTGHLWSLSVEEQFYLIWPLTLYWMLGRRHIVAMVWTVVFGLALCNLSCYDGHPPHLMIYTRGISMIIGCAVAITAYYRAGASVFGNIVYSVTSTRYLLLIVAILFGVISYFVVAEHATTSMMMPLWIPFFSLATSLLIANFWYAESPALANFFRYSYLSGLGRISYGGYIYHMAVHQFVWYKLLVGIQAWNPYLKFGVRMLSFVALTVLLAWLSYRYFEKPILDVKNRYRSV